MVVVNDNDGLSINAAEEDIISRLPDDIIHRILSFLDTKHAVQTSTLSRKWKLIWTTMPYLNFNFQTFGSSSQFTNYVKQALSQRNNGTEVSAVKLTLIGGACYQLVGRSIIEYAYSHHVRKLTLIWLNLRELPNYLFSCHTLKHLTLKVGGYYDISEIPILTWDFPALETLNLRDLRLELGDSELEDDTGISLNLFSKCVNLKDLTLHGFKMYGVETFHVCTPKLSNLTITDPKGFPKVINVVAPQLKNLTASIKDVFSWGCLHLSTEGFDSLEKVNLSSISSHGNERCVPIILDLFQKLRSAKYLSLNVDVIKALSLGMDQLSHEPCPFNNLKCLKIYTKQNDCVELLPTQVRNYFLHNSPNVTFITDLAQEITKAQDEVIAEQKAKIQMEDEVLEHCVSQMVKAMIVHLEEDVESGNLDHETIRSMGDAMKYGLELIPESLRVKVEAQFCWEYEEFKNLYLTDIDAAQWKMIETELGDIIEGFQIN